MTGILEALHWQAGLRDDEIMGKREEVIAALEFAGAEQRKSGMLEAWFGNCDPHVREVKSSLVFAYLAIALCVCVASGGK